MADGSPTTSPCTSVAPLALHEPPEAVARRLAEDLLESRQRVMRGVGVGVGVGVGIGTVTWSIVGLGGLFLGPMVIMATGLALSTSMLTLALLSTVFDMVVTHRWTRVAQAAGFDAETATRAIEDARRQLAEQAAWRSRRAGALR